MSMTFSNEKEMFDTLEVLEAALVLACESLCYRCPPLYSDVEKEMDYFIGQAKEQINTRKEAEDAERLNQHTG